MKSSASYEREIARLQVQRTALFDHRKWIEMQAVSAKIKLAWEGYHRAKAREDQEKQDRSGCKWGCISMIWIVFGLSVILCGCQRVEFKGQPLAEIPITTFTNGAQFNGKGLTLYTNQRPWTSEDLLQAISRCPAGQMMVFGDWRKWANPDEVTFVGETTSGDKFFYVQNLK